MDEPTDHDHIERIRQQEAIVREKELELRSCQEAVKEAREDLSMAIAKLRTIIRNGPEEQMELPLSSDDDADFEEQWAARMKTRLEDAITLTKSERETFEAVGVYTVADFERLRAGQIDGYHGLTALKGIGQAKADRLEDAVLEWADRERKTMTEPVS